MPHSAKYIPDGIILSIMLFAMSALTLLPAGAAGGRTLPGGRKDGPQFKLKRYAQHDPARRVVFVIKLAEEGKASDTVGWSMKGEARYAILPTWDGSTAVDLSALEKIPGREKMGAGRETAPSSEELFDLRGGLLGLKEGESIQFYRKESRDEGKGWMDGDRHSWNGSKKDGYSEMSVDGSSPSGDKEALADNADAKLTRTKSGAILKFYWWLDPGWQDLGVSANICGLDTPEAERVLTFVLTDDDLRHWENLMKTNQGSFRHPEWADVTGTMTATLSAVRLPDDEVEVYATAGDGYAAWQPKGNIDHPEEPGNDLEIKVSVQKKGDPGKPRKARFFVSIPSVSMNVGVCGNWPKGAREAEGLRFLDKDFPEKDGLLFKDKTHLESDIFMEKASFRVHAYDYGAWGTVRITARDEDGKELKVKVNGKDSPDLDVPQDDDSNRIADSWRRDKAFKHNMNEDNESVQGQDAKGDGITLYNEYRGLAILNDQGARKHKQLDPDLKEMFVLDPAKKLLMKKWEDITAIRSYRVDELSVDPDGNTGPGESPLVNFNSEDKTAHPFYALKVVVLAKGPDDNPYPAFAESAKDEPKCIKNAFAVYVVPSRAVERVQEDYEWLDAAITEPDSNIGKELREKGPAMGIVYEDAVEAWHRLQDPDLRKTISAKIEAFLFCHEIGHILGADDHRGAPPDGLQEEGWACVMFNQREWGRRRTLVHTAMGRGDATFPFPYRDFCRGLSAEFDCYRLLNVKDW